MKKIIIIILIIICCCGCSSDISFKGKVFVCNKNKTRYIYNFISDSSVLYEYINSDSTGKKYNCNYQIETENMIKVVCSDGVRLLLYDKDKDCINDHNSRVYCIK